MREEIRNQVLAKNSETTAASEPLQAAKRKKKEVEYTSYRRNVEQGRGFLEATQIPSSLTSASAATEERLPSFSFPVNFSSQPTSEARDEKMIYEALNTVTTSMRPNSNQEHQQELETMPIPPIGRMAPPPARPPKNKRSPLPPAAHFHTCITDSAFSVANTRHNNPNYHHRHHHHRTNHSPVSTSPTPGTRTSGSAKTALNGNQNPTTCLDTNNSQFIEDLPEAIAMLSSLYADLQHRVSTLDATFQTKDGEILKLTTASVATNNAIQSMRIEWKNLVFMMQRAISEHSGTLTRHADSILFLRNKLIDAENRSREDKNEIMRLRSEVESMSQQMIQMESILEAQDAARRSFEEQVLNHLTAVHQMQSEQGKNQAQAAILHNGSNNDMQLENLHRPAEAGTGYTGAINCPDG